MWTPNFIKFPSCVHLLQASSHNDTNHSDNNKKQLHCKKPSHLCHGRWIPEKLQIAGPATQSTTKCHDRLSPNSRHSWPPVPSCTLERQQRMLHPPSKLHPPFQLQVLLYIFWLLGQVYGEWTFQKVTIQCIRSLISLIIHHWHITLIVITKMLVNLPSLMVSIRL